jgi:hypothetical protein
MPASFRSMESDKCVPSDGQLLAGHKRYRSRSRKTSVIQCGNVRGNHFGSQADERQLTGHDETAAKFPASTRNVKAGWLKRVYRLCRLFQRAANARGVLRVPRATAVSDRVTRLLDKLNENKEF